MDVLSLMKNTVFTYAVGSVQKGDIYDLDYEYSTYRSEAKDRLNAGDIVSAKITKAVSPTNKNYVEIELNTSDDQQVSLIDYRVNYPETSTKQKTQTIKVRHLPGVTTKVAQVTAEKAKVQAVKDVYEQKTDTSSQLQSGPIGKIYEYAGITSPPKRTTAGRRKTMKRRKTRKQRR